MMRAPWRERPASRRALELQRVGGNFAGGPPILFETMIFGGPEDQYTDRCSTWDEAVKMHEKACAVAFPTH